MADKIQRRKVVTEEIEVPDGYESCARCKGYGMTSKYDEGFSSFVHSDDIDAKKVCYVCSGLGYTLKEPHLSAGWRGDWRDLRTPDMLARAEMLEKYYRQLPEGVSSEAGAEAELIRMELRKRGGA